MPSLMSASIYPAVTFLLTPTATLPSAPKSWMSPYP
jgi:hypothetical protein